MSFDEDPIKEYRGYLFTAAQKAQEDHDKAVLSLSGGALGISFAFIKDIVGTNPLVAPELLSGAWISWAVSVTCILGSFYLSEKALRRAINELDSGNIARTRPGGGLSRATEVLNFAAGLAFLIGVTLMSLFVLWNHR